MEAYKTQRRHLPAGELDELLNFYWYESNINKPGDYPTEDFRFMLADAWIVIVFRI
jgi:hypothetical protein